MIRIRTVSVPILGQVRGIAFSAFKAEKFTTYEKFTKPDKFTKSYKSKDYSKDRKPKSYTSSKTPYNNRQNENGDEDSALPRGLRSKLDYFIETGDIPSTPMKRKNRSMRFDPTTKSGSEAKLKYALMKLKNQFDGATFLNPDGTVLEIFKLKSHDLKPSNPISKIIFENIYRVKKFINTGVDRNLLYALLGTNSFQIKDSYFVTSNVIQLLEWDKDPERALRLLKMVDKEAAVVGMNTICKWLFDKGDVKAAVKNFHDRSKWGVKPNAQSYIILFDGLAKNHAWGEVTNGISEDMISIFDKYREQSHKAFDGVVNSKRKFDLQKNKTTINHFNALLNFLVKNYNDDQKLAWDFFDRLVPDPKSDLPNLIPDCQTFTIFIDGINRYSLYKADQIMNSNELSANEKEIKLLDIQARQIETSESILQKVITEATPPPPPTKEEVLQNPELLEDYRKVRNRILIDIEPAFASVFTGAFINKSGTGVKSTVGSHYRYVEQGLTYLKLWCKEINSILEFAYKTNHTEIKDGIIQASNSIKSITDNRVSKAIESYTKADIEIDTILPEKVCPKYPEQSEVNPLVIFPPPLSSKNKTKATFSNFKKPLVDFARSTSSEQRLLALDDSFKTSRGKFGSRLTERQKDIINREKIGVNKFLLHRMIDALIYLGRYEQFHTSILYILSKWGGIHIPKINGRLQPSLDAIYLPKFVQSPEEIEEVKALTHVKQFEVKYLEDVVDIISVENFIFKLNENVRNGGKNSTALITEIFGMLVSKHTNIKQGLKIRNKTVDAMFASFVKDLFYFSDYNYNTLVLQKENNQVSKKSITADQLQTYLSSLDSFMTSLLVLRNEEKNFIDQVLFSSDIESYNKIISRIYENEWLEIDENDLQTHKQIIKSGILFYRPTELRKIEGKELSSSAICKSINLVYTKLKDESEESLSEKDKSLIRNLKNLLKIKSRKENENLRPFIERIYLSI
ncbi:hypothetical protein DFJ63DRAFT_310122 [Scheffersomyces coipomensis]|uniref:uncharacterized protein n=1 Tax=Scheffersomyces coipomensis TaxID=1788519 RepID=UPI00315D12CB